MTKRNRTTEPPYDIILVGATGYVGALIADVLVGPRHRIAAEPNRKRGPLPHRSSQGQAPAAPIRPVPIKIWEVPAHPRVDAINQPGLSPSARVWPSPPAAERSTPPRIRAGSSGRQPNEGNPGFET